MASHTLVQFPRRADAYAFAAELRRVVDLADTASLRVHDTDRGLIVALTEPLTPYGGLAEIAQRFHGQVAAAESVESMREAIAGAEAVSRETAGRLRSSHVAVAKARAALDRSRTGQPKGSA